MVDAVFPQAILTPGITMIRATDGVGMSKSVQQGADSFIDPLQAECLAASTLLGIVVIRKWTAWIVLSIPGCTFVVVGHMGLTNVEKHKDLLSIQTSQLFINPAQLLVQ